MPDTELIRLKTELTQANTKVADLEGRLAAKEVEARQHEATAAALKTERDTAKETLRSQRNEVEAAKNRVAELNQKNAALEARISAITQTRPAMRLDTLMQHFQQRLAELNHLTAAAGPRERLKVAVESLDVELKGGLEFRDDAVHLSQPLPQELTPETVSALRFTLRPVTEVKFDE